MEFTEYKFADRLCRRTDVLWHQKQTRAIIARQTDNELARTRVVTFTHERHDVQIVAYALTNKSNVVSEMKKEPVVGHEQCARLVITLR